MLAFPIVYAASSVVIPIGVLIYWLTSSLWTMGQQGLLIRNNPAQHACVHRVGRMLAKGKDPQAITLLGPRSAAAPRRTGPAQSRPDPSRRPTHGG